jgi:uncharacterized membrane protein YdjX (TVP38/TMEM64 family)
MKNSGLPASTSTRSSSILLKRVVPLTVLVVGLLLFLIFDVGRFVSFEILREHRETLQLFVAENTVLTALGVVLLYAVVVAFSVPVGIYMTLTIGFLFGTVGGGLMVVVGATTGATALFLIARFALGDLLQAKVGPSLPKMQDGFNANALSYLLVLRLVPLFPFWLVNLVPAFLGVSAANYVIGTFIGIIPGTFVTTSIGNGLGAILDAGEDPNLRVIFQLEVLGPLVALALLSLLPVLYKRHQTKKNQPSKP